MGTRDLELFECKPFRARITRDACARNFRAANGPTKTPPNRWPCRECPVGRRHAQGGVPEGDAPTVASVESQADAPPFPDAPPGPPPAAPIPKRHERAPRSGPRSPVEREPASHVPQEPAGQERPAQEPGAHPPSEPAPPAAPPNPPPSEGDPPGPPQPRRTRSPHRCSVCRGTGHNRQRCPRLSTRPTPTTPEPPASETRQIRCRFPLRPRHLVTVMVPDDLTATEAKRMARWLETLATVDQ